MAGNRYQVILLNGPTSSGKSTIAREVQKICCEPWFHLSIDVFYSFMPGQFYGDLGIIRTQLVPALHRCAAAFVKNGSRVILDHVLFEPAWYRDCDEVLAPFSVLRVGLRCALSVLQERELQRGDRIRGLAQSQIERVHHHHGLHYDLEIHTDKVDQKSAAAMIMRFLDPDLEIPVSK